MSQTKRPGARDISDLKARLGLKKTSTQSPPVVGPPTETGTPAIGHVVPPPTGVPQTSNVPDPFAAVRSPVAATSSAAGSSNAMARSAVPQPDFIAEPLAMGTQASGIGLKKVAALMVLPLVIGVFVGKMGQSASEYNQVIEDAAPIKENVKTVRRALINLSAVLQEGKVNDKFVTGDAKLTENLSAVKDIVGDDELVFTSSVYHLDSKISREIYTFYSDLHTLNAELQEHVRAAKTEAKILKDGVEQLKGFNPLAYGAVLKFPASSAPAGSPVVAQLVQLGDPICEGESRPNPQGCAGAVARFAYRADETASWRFSDVAVGTDAVPSGQVIRLDPSTKTIKQLVGGGQMTVAEAAYQKRLSDIESRVLQLSSTGKTIEEVLNNKSNESTKFSFFF